MRSTGRGAFDGRPVPAASLAVLYSNYTQIVTLASSRHPARRGSARPHGVDRIAGQRNGGDRAAPADGRRARSGNATCSGRGSARRESADALKDGKIDAFFWSGGLPTAAHPGPRRTRPASPSGWCRAPISCRRCGATTATSTSGCGSRQARTPASTATCAVVGVANVLVVNRAMSDDLAYDITRLLFERQAELADDPPGSAQPRRSPPRSRDRRRRFIPARCATTAKRESSP